MCPTQAIIICLNLATTFFIKLKPKGIPSLKPHASSQLFPCLDRQISSACRLVTIHAWYFVDVVYYCGEFSGHKWWVGHQ